MGPMLRGIVMFGCGTAGLAEGVAAPRPFLRTLQQMTNVPKSVRPAGLPAADRGRSRPGLSHGDTSTDSHQDPDRRRLRALVLRAGAVPVDRVRRPDPAEAGGLSLRGPVQRGDPARPGVGRADLRRLRRQGEAIDLGDTGDAEATIEMDSRYAPIPDGHAGDAAPEDAARRDLRRADPRQQRGAVAARGRRAADRRRWRRRSSSTRSSAPSTPGPVPRSRPGCRALRWRCTAAARTSRSRSGRSTRSPRRPTAALRILDSQSNAVSGLIRNGGDGLRGALRAPGPARRPDPQHRRPCSRRPRSATRT